MSMGIAKLFRKEFGDMEALKDCTEIEVGDIAISKVGSRYIYNLITKAKCGDKPEYPCLRGICSDRSEIFEEHCNI